MGYLLPDFLLSHDNIDMLSRSHRSVMFLLFREGDITLMFHDSVGHVADNYLLNICSCTALFMDFRIAKLLGLFGVRIDFLFSVHTTRF